MRIVAGRFRGRSLPEVEGARPAPGRLVASLFDALAPVLAGTRVLDLFAGAGRLGLEALSRGAASVVLVERDPRAARRLHRWLEEAEATREARVLVRDAGRDALPAGPFDIVFFDPPYAAWEGEDARTALARAVERLAEGGVVVAKMPAARAIPGDPRWREVRRTPVGSNAWVLVRAAGAPR